MSNLSFFRETTARAALMLSQNSRVPQKRTHKKKQITFLLLLLLLLFLLPRIIKLLYWVYVLLSLCQEKRERRAIYKALPPSWEPLHQRRRGGGEERLQRGGRPFHHQPTPHPAFWCDWPPHYPSRPPQSPPPSPSSRLKVRRRPGSPSLWVSGCASVNYTYLWQVQLKLEIWVLFFFFFFLALWQ